MKGRGRSFEIGIGWLVVLVAIGFVSSCGTKVQSTRLYLMDYVPIVEKPDDAPGPLPYSVQVREFKIPRTFDRTRIVYRYSPHELNYYRYYQWAVPPRVMITDLVEKHVAASGLFEVVQREFFDERPDYEVKGTIIALEKFESGEFGGSHLAMSLEEEEAPEESPLLLQE